MHTYLHSSTLVIVNSVTNMTQTVVETVEALTSERRWKLPFVSPDPVQSHCVSSAPVTFPLCCLLGA
jgi:hypothetical protein